MRKQLKKKIILGGLFFLLLMSVGCGKNDTEENVTVKKPSQIVGQDRTEQDRTEEESAEQERVEAEKQPDDNTSNLKPTKEPEKFEFPIALDENRLEIGSVYGSAMINPDCENAYGEEIATIQLKNVSGNYLKSAKIQVKLSNGDTFHFVVEELPTDMELMAFDIENQDYDNTYRVEDIQVETEYGEIVSADEVSWSVTDSEITVENKSNKKKKNITIYYHCVIDDWGYGGTAYELMIDSLEPGESRTVTEQYCFVGDVKISNVTYK